MNLVLFDTSQRKLLYPFTLTRPVADIRVGIFTIREFWERYFQLTSFTITEQYLQEKFPNTTTNTVILVNSSLLPNEEFFSLLIELKDDEAIVDGENVLAAKTSSYNNWQVDDIQLEKFSTHKRVGSADYLLYPWQIFQLNDAAIKYDYDVITMGRTSASVSSTNQLINPDKIFAEEGAKLQHAILNAEKGPIYIGKNCEIMEGSIIRGPFAMLDGSVVKMGTKIYGATVLGPKCVAGGEIKNSIMVGYSNKAHDGYLGDSVIGEWCNIGAGTSNSNLKNTADTVKVWSHEEGKFVPAGNKCGLMMGDYSRCAINTSFNTGTVTGVSCNMFGAGLSPKYIPDFSWGFTNDNKYDFSKACDAINNWKKLKNQFLTEAEKNILKHIFEQL
ncbi:MAG: glucose-1-phosphate thymidylyltransferase [Sphingobacteriales bacterium]|nr:glucose-1-phosphate thymidylyltransferase [Sphingobacteriales bacterium]